MSDIIVDLALGSPEEDAKLAAALDSFLSEHITRNPMSDDYPQMIVRTAVCPLGNMHKEIIFQSQKWAEAFQSFWEIQKMQASAA
ncbi:MAG: hypothetical protein GYB49_17215 [Alphaproteobacteria bacterium]|nr:hypothetical protein [Hyphomonas sp.]MBR9808955.1 hypothetical protein [Alphaproteobacteria bacterium]|tara:strand:+ start:2698 stop:2952 length:255 start_codon:yes stop_codon:yes gene_type:complete